VRRLALTRLVFTARLAQPTHAFPGDKCQSGDECKGELYVYSSGLNEQGQRVRYLKCNLCGHLPENNKWVE